MNQGLYRGLRVVIVSILLATFAAPPLAYGQTQKTSTGATTIVLHKNHYSPRDDVQIGREAAISAPSAAASSSAM